MHLQSLQKLGGNLSTISQKKSLYGLARPIKIDFWNDGKKYLVKKLAMGVQSNQFDLVAVQFVNQQQIRLNVALTIAVHVAFEWVV